MTQPLRDIQFFRNSDVTTLSTYNDLTTRMTTLVTTDTQDVFKDGQIVLGRYVDENNRIRSVGGIVCVNSGSKYIDFIANSEDVNITIRDTLLGLNGTAVIANLQSGTLTLRSVTQTNGAINTGNDICVLYLDTNMSSTNPLVSSSTVDTKIINERNKNYINSALYQYGTPLHLTQTEITTLSQVYTPGHIVFDSNTQRFYAWFGDGWGYPTVSVTIPALAMFDGLNEILYINDKPIDISGLFFCEGYASTYGMPSDWSTNWSKYYLWDDVDGEYYLNTNSTYDSNKVYFVKYRKPIQ